MKTVLYFICALVAIFSISCMRSVNLLFTNPSVVMVKAHIKNVVILNRSMPQNKNANILESVLTGELPWDDKQGIEQALIGLQQQLATTSRFATILAKETYKGSGSGTSFPQYMEWKELDKIAKKYDADAVLALETYDSDYKVTNCVKDVVQTDKEGRKTTVKQHFIQSGAVVKLGFRLYDVTNHSIVDQQQYVQSQNWNTPSATRIEDVVRQVLSKNQAVREASLAAGANYASQLIPTQSWVNREYYRKGHNGLAVGARSVRVNDWETAEKAWQEALDNAGDTKTKGRAAFNLALASEYWGDLPKAMEYAQKAYRDYGNKKAPAYYSVLNRRMQAYERLKQQLEE